MKPLLVTAALIGLLMTSCSSSGKTTAATLATVDLPTATSAMVTTPAPVTTVQRATPTTTTARAAATTAAPSTTAKPDRPLVNYGPAAGPNPPGSTHVVPGDNSHPDGVYFGTIGVGGDPPPPAGSVVFELVQLFTGADCLAHFGATDEQACANDYGVESTPTAFVVVPLTDQYISVVDSATQKSFQVTGDELYRLVQNQPPAAAAPAGYVYSGFSYIVTYKGGKVTRLEQWWTP